MTSHFSDRGEKVSSTKEEALAEKIFISMQSRDTMNFADGGATVAFAAANHFLRECESRKKDK